MTIAVEKIENAGIENRSCDAAEIAELVQRLPYAFAVWDVVADEQGRATDLVFVFVNSAMEELIGRTRDALLGKSFDAVFQSFGDDDFDWTQTLGGVAAEQSDSTFEAYLNAPARKWAAVQAYSLRPGRVATVLQDITHEKRTQQALSLQRSNVE